MRALKRAVCLILAFLMLTGNVGPVSLLPTSIAETPRDTQESVFPCAVPEEESLNLFLLGEDLESGEWIVAEETPLPSAGEPAPARSTEPDDAAALTQEAETAQEPDLTEKGPDPAGDTSEAAGDESAAANNDPAAADSETNAAEKEPEETVEEPEKTDRETKETVEESEKAETEAKELPIAGETAKQFTKTSTLPLGAGSAGYIALHGSIEFHSDYEYEQLVRPLTFNQTLAVVPLYAKNGVVMEGAPWTTQNISRNGLYYIEVYRDIDGNDWFEIENVPKTVTVDGTQYPVIGYNVTIPDPQPSYYEQDFLNYSTVLDEAYRSYYEEHYESTYGISFKENLSEVAKVANLNVTLRLKNTMMTLNSTVVPDDMEHTPFI